MIEPKLYNALTEFTVIQPQPRPLWVEFEALKIHLFYYGEPCKKVLFILIKEKLKIAKMWIGHFIPRNAVTVTENVTVTDKVTVTENAS